MLITDKDTPHRTLRRFIFCGRHKKGAQEISPVYPAKRKESEIQNEMGLK